MTPTANARLAGASFLVYIAAGVAGMALFARAAAGENVTARLASIAQHATDVRVTVLLALVQGFCALVLAVTLFALTARQDRDIAMFGLVCRVAEGITGVFVARTLGLLWLATSDAVADPAAATALGGFLLRMGAWNPGAILFAAGSAAFAWLLLRARLIPAALAWLGLAASLLLMIVLPLQLAGFGGAVTRSFGWWMPMLVFEVALALRLLISAVPEPGCSTAS
jgi:hypothetical protein